MKHVLILILLGLLSIPAYAQTANKQERYKNDYCSLNKQTMPKKKKKNISRLHQEMIFSYQQQTQSNQEPNKIFIHIRQF